MARPTNEQIEKRELLRSKKQIRDDLIRHIEQCMKSSSLSKVTEGRKLLVRLQVVENDIAVLEGKPKEEPMKEKPKNEEDERQLRQELFGKKEAPKSFRKEKDDDSFLFKIDEETGKPYFETTIFIKEDRKQELRKRYEKMMDPKRRAVKGEPMKRRRRIIPS